MHSLKPIAIALEGKGPTTLLRRVRTITSQYGFNPGKMDRALAQLSQILKQFNCCATLPITTVALARNIDIIKKYQTQGTEFAIHGYRHIDYSLLTLAEQEAHVRAAGQIFQKHGIDHKGFRCPYLRWNADTLTAVTNGNLSYDSSQALYWEGVGEQNTETYQHVLKFYGAKPARDFPALPKIMGQIVQIPYSVPDDESLVERLNLDNAEARTAIWLAILEQTHQTGELFTLGLHPERTILLEKPLADTLAKARSLSPQIWIARLDEIAGWWQSRTRATFEVTEEAGDLYRLTTTGPAGTTILARNVEVESPLTPGPDGFHTVQESSFRIRGEKRPWIGVSDSSSPALLSFLRQQGYWVEVSHENMAYSIYLHQPEFTAREERPLLKQLASNGGPLLRFGRWPYGAQSAMCVTGDIDALTIWDYVLRFFGK